MSESSSSLRPEVAAEAEPRVQWTPEVYRLAEYLRTLMYPEGAPTSQVPVLEWPDDEPMNSELLRLRLLRQIRLFAPTTLTRH